MPIAILSNRSIISLKGEDTIDFLQGLISNDARKLSKNEAIYAAMLSPQGRFLHDFFLVPCGEKIFIDVAANRANDLLSRLKMYRLRSKVEIEVEDELSVAVCDHAEGVGDNVFIYPDPRLPALGFRIIGKIEENSAQPEEYEKLRISLCVPDTADMIIEKSLLLEFGFEELHGVDFNKGCYVGQEVTARSKFRGSVRKSLYNVESEGKLPALGTKIMTGDKEIGELRTSINNIGIAIINNDDYEAAKIANTQFFCDGKPAKISPPIWQKKSK